jgi:hypothetical protein
MEERLSKFNVISAAELLLLPEPSLRDAVQEFLSMVSFAGVGDGKVRNDEAVGRITENFFPLLRRLSA